MSERDSESPLNSNYKNFIAEYSAIVELRKKAKFWIFPVSIIVGLIFGAILGHWGWSILFTILTFFVYDMVCYLYFNFLRKQAERRYQFNEYMNERWKDNYD